MQELVLPILLGLQLLLLMRQSLLLLRPLCDLSLNSSIRANAWLRPTYIQRIRRHGSGASITFLLILSLLFFSPSLFALFNTHKILLVLGAVWASIHFTALIATGFRHFSGLAFSSRDAGPADFGRRWPFWPDGMLWLCELGYLGLLYMGFCSYKPRFTLCNGYKNHIFGHAAIRLLAELEKAREKQTAGLLCKIHGA